MLLDESTLLVCQLHVHKSTARHPSENPSGFRVGLVPFLVDAKKLPEASLYLHHTPPQTPEEGSGGTWPVHGGAVCPQYGHRKGYLEALRPFRVPARIVIVLNTPATWFPGTSHDSQEAPQSARNLRLMRRHKRQRESRWYRTSVCRSCFTFVCVCAERLVDECA